MVSSPHPFLHNFSPTDMHVRGPRMAYDGLGLGSQAELGFPWWPWTLTCPPTLSLGFSIHKMGTSEAIGTTVHKAT